MFLFASIIFQYLLNKKKIKQMDRKKKKKTKLNMQCPIISLLLCSYSHTVTDLATHRTITNYDPRRRLRTPTSTLSGATKQTASNYNTHNNHNNNGFVVADSSSTYNNH